MSDVVVVENDSNNLVVVETETHYVFVGASQGPVGPQGEQGDGDVDGPGSSTTNNFPSFADTTGKLLQDSGYGAASFQPIDAGLTSISGLTTAADKMIYTTASDTYAVTDLTAFARTILDDADAATARATLELGSAATTASSDYATAAQGTKADSAIQPTATDASTYGFVLDEDSMASNSATKLATQQSIKAYVDSRVVGMLDYQGGYDASTNTPDLDTSPSGILQGYVYTVTAAGTFFSAAVEVGDFLIAEQDNPTLESHWTIVQANLTASMVLALLSGQALAVDTVAATTSITPASGQDAITDWVDSTEDTGQSVSGSGGSAGTYAASAYSMTYTRHGNMVRVDGILFQVTDKGSWSGDVRLGVPFTCASGTYAYHGQAVTEHHTIGTNMVAVIVSGQSYVRIRFSNTGTTSNFMQWSDISTTTGNAIRFSVEFPVD